MFVCKLKDHDKGESVIYKPFIWWASCIFPCVSILSINCHGIFRSSTQIIAQHISVLPFITSVNRSK